MDDTVLQWFEVNIHQRVIGKNMKRTTGILLGVIGGMMAGLSPTVYANDNEVILPDYIAESVIGGDAVSNASGVVGVNVSAGDFNQQSNSGAVAISPNGIATTTVGISQKTALGQGSAPDISITGIRDSAFSNSSGVLSINQVSGTSNVQANGFSFGIGVEAITDADLSQAVTGYANDAALSGLEKPTIRIADIEATAFENTRGIVQVNQTAGSGNATRNNFALRISTGAK